jgi:ligand-binding sensor domain-containing protein/two-component sensor histidine kinase
MFYQFYVMMMCRTILIVALFLSIQGFLIINCFAQLPSIKFESITSEDGLPSNAIYAAMRDKKGFMWFGTRLCPVRYDGASFQAYRDFETTFVSGLAEDREGKIWFASSESKVCYIDAATHKITPVKETGNGGDFYIDSKGRGWYSDRSGVNRLTLETGRQVHYSFAADKYILNKGSFIEDSDRNLWVIGRNNGLFRYDEKQDKLLCLLGSDCKDSSRSNQMLLTKACADRQRFLWIGSYNSGLIKYNTQSGIYESFATGRPDNTITAVAEGVDDNGKRIIWVGDRQGIGIFRPEQNKFFFFEDVRLGQFEVNSIFRDPAQGIVWICTSAGIIKYNPNSDKIKTVAIPKGLVNFPVMVNAVVKDKTHPDDEIYYLGLSHTGMLRWDRSTNEFLLIPYESDQAETSWITQRSDGNLWIGTLRWDYKRPGIFVYDPAKEKFTRSSLSRLANKRFSVPFFHYGFFDSRDKLWIGNSDEGIRMFDEKLNAERTPWDSITQHNFIKDDNLINSVIETRSGRIVAGGYHGVFQADEKSNRFIALDTMAKEFPSVNSILEDKEGNIWAARWGALTQVTPEGVLKTILTVHDGFYDRENRGLAEDSRGNIWIGNWEGLYCYDTTNKQLLRFTTKDGLVNNNTVNRIFMPDSANELLVGQMNSFNVVKIDQLIEYSNNSVLAVSNFKIQDREYFSDFLKPIVLKRFDNSFSVDVIALNYRKEHENQYAYYLEGLEEGWKYSGSIHLIRYTDLKPGKYILHVRAGDGIERWYDKALHLRIEVLPAFYETWWFAVLVVLIVVGILYSLYRFRINQILRLQEVQNLISADLHDELGSSLSSISIMGALAQKSAGRDDGSSQFVSRIVEEVQVISGSLDDIVWNISPKHDTLSSLIARMTRYASELFDAKEIRYEFSFPKDVEGIRLSMEQRRNFYLIFKESVNNLVKYSQCSLASIRIEVSKRNLLLIIEDDGIGFDMNRQNDRNGIRNLKERGGKLNGKLDIQSIQGKGTTVKLQFPTKG